MCEAVVLDEMGGLGAFAGSGSAEHVDDGHLLWVKGRCGVCRGGRRSGLKRGIRAGCWVYGGHVEWARWLSYCEVKSVRGAEALEITAGICRFSGFRLRSQVGAGLHEI